MTSALVLISGLPATGKTTTANGLARELHTVAFSRDWAREVGVRPLRSRIDLLADDVYGRLNRGHRPKAQRLANALLFELVKRHVSFAHPVVVEVVADPQLRDALERIAMDHEIRFVQLECECSERSAWEARLAARGGNWTASIDRIEGWYRPPSPSVFRLDSCSMSPDEMVDAARLHAG